MNFNGALLIAVAIAFAGLYVGDAIRSLHSLKVDMTTKVRIVDGAETNGPQ